MQIKIGDLTTLIKGLTQLSDNIKVPARISVRCMENARLLSLFNKACADRKIQPDVILEFGFHPIKVSELGGIPESEYADIINYLVKD